MCHKEDRTAAPSHEVSLHKSQDLTQRKNQAVLLAPGGVRGTTTAYRCGAANVTTCHVVSSQAPQGQPPSS